MVCDYFGVRNVPSKKKKTTSTGRALDFVCTFYKNEEGDGFEFSEFHLRLQEMH